MVRKKTCVESDRRLPWKHSIPQRCELLVQCKAVPFIGDPARRETHKPFHERRCRTRSRSIAKECGGWRWTAHNLLPSDHRFGVSSPSLKSCPISVHRVSGSSGCGYPFGPWRARSMI